MFDNGKILSAGGSPNYDDDDPTNGFSYGDLHIVQRLDEKWGREEFLENFLGISDWGETRPMRSERETFLDRLVW